MDMLTMVVHTHWSMIVVEARASPRMECLGFESTRGV